MRPVTLFRAALAACAATLAACAATLGLQGVARANLTMPYGVGTTTYSVMNVGTGTATVASTYYNPNGTSPAGSGFTQTLAPNARLDITAGQTPDGPLPLNWSGSVVLSSDQDIIAVAQTKYTGRLNAETGPIHTPGTEASAYEAFNSGATDIFFPTLVRVKRTDAPSVAQLSTRYTIQNTSGNPATVYLNYRNRSDGTTYTPTVITLAGYGSRTFDTTIDTDLPNGMDIAPDTIAFSARVTATQPIVGVAEQSWNLDGLIGPTPVKQNWVADYTAIPASEATTTLFVPNFSRVGQSASGMRPCTLNVYTNYAFYTAMVVQNTAATTATVTAEFFRSNAGAGVNAPSGNATFTTSVQIPPFASWNLNTFAGGGLGFNAAHPIWGLLSDGYNAGTGAAIHCNWAGAVRITSDQPLVGYGAIQQPLSAQNYASWYNLYGASGASSTALLPRVDRVCTGPCNPAAVEQFPAFAGLNVQNVGSITTTLTITFYKPDGTVQQVYTVDGGGNLLDVGPGAQIAFNTRAGANFSITQTQSLGNSFRGSARVTATGGVPIRAFVNLISGADDADAYLGFNR